MSRQDAPKGRGPSVLLLTAGLATLLSGFGCGPSDQPQTGTQTNWLVSCDTDAECGGLTCICGVCTHSCAANADCKDTPGASCVPGDDIGAVAMCRGSAPSAPGVCIPRCPAAGCSPGASCVAGVCVPDETPEVDVDVDESVRHQSLVGYGAALNFIAGEIAEHPRKAALFETMFSDSGINVLRLRNRHGQPDEEPAEATTEIVAAATSLLGRSPIIVMTSASPPPALKVSGAALCDGDQETCTLTRLPSGGFNYEGFANYWRDALETFAALGLSPDYISIQTNPNWVPPAVRPREACRFLPREGSTLIDVNGTYISMEYPGYVEALQAVRTALSDLPRMPRIIAPDTTNTEAGIAYVADLDPAHVDVLGHRLYEEMPTPERFQTLRDLGRSLDLPLFQTEMTADALTTAVLMHNTLAVEGVSLYVQNDFVGSSTAEEPDETAFISLTADDFVVNDTFHVMRHYAAHTGPGWVNVSASADTDGLLASGWLSPDGSQLTFVITNPQSTDYVIRIDAAGATRSSVTRSVLSGTERSANLGSLPQGGWVILPGQSIATVVLER